MPSDVGDLDGTIPTTWSILQTGDYNGDGMTDLLWRDNLGNTAIWLMNAFTIASTAGIGNIPTNWTVQSVNGKRCFQATSLSAVAAGENPASTILRHSPRNGYLESFESTTDGGPWSGAR